MIAFPVDQFGFVQVASAGHIGFTPYDWFESLMFACFVVKFLGAEHVSVVSHRYVPSSRRRSPSRSEPEAYMRHRGGELGMNMKMHEVDHGAVPNSVSW